MLLKILFLCALANATEMHVFMCALTPFAPPKFCTNN